MAANGTGDFSFGNGNWTARNGLTKIQKHMKENEVDSDFIAAIDAAVESTVRQIECAMKKRDFFFCSSVALRLRDDVISQAEFTIPRCLRASGDESGAETRHCKANIICSTQNIDEMKERLGGVSVINIVNDSVTKSKIGFCPLVMSGVTTNMTISKEDIAVTNIYYKGNIVVHVKKIMNDVVIYNMDPILDFNSILSNAGNLSFMLSCSCTILHVVSYAMFELWKKRITGKYETEVYVLMSKLFEENVSALRLPAVSVVETIDKEETQGEAGDNVFNKKRILEMVVQAWSLFYMAVGRVIRDSKVSVDLTGPKPKVTIDIPLGLKFSISIPLPPVWGN